MTVVGPATEDLLAGHDLAARIAHLHAQGLANAGGLGWVLDRAEDLVHLKPSDAGELAALCDGAADRLGLPAVAARARYLLARVSAERGDLERALRLISEAHEAWVAAGDLLPALRTNLGRMSVLDDLGRHEESAHVGEQLIRRLDQVGAADGQRDLYELVRGTALNNLGVAYSFVGEHERALESYALAETTYRRIGRTEEIGKPLANRGIEQLALGRSREGLEALLEARSVFEGAGDRLWAAKCAGNAASAHQQLGELTHALRILEQARATLEELDAGMEAQRVRQTLAEVYLAAGLLQEAKVEASEVASRTASAGMAHDAGRARFTLALAHRLSGDLDDARRELDAARALFESVGDRQLLARLTLAEADVVAAAGRTPLAAALADNAAAALAEGGWLVPLAWARLRQADLAQSPEAVEAHLGDASVLVDDLDLPPLRYAYLLRVGLHRRRQHRDGEAEAALREAVRVADEMGSALPDQALRIAFRADKLAAHDQLVDLLVDRGTGPALDEACSVGDRAKAQTLLDLAAGTLGSSHASPRRETSDLLERLDRLRAELNASFAALLGAEGSTRRELVRQRSRRIEQQISSLRLRMVAAATPGQASSPDAITQVETPGAGLRLSYHVVGTDVVAFVGNESGVEARRLRDAAPRAKLELDRLAAQWSRFSMGAALMRRHGRVLQQTSVEILRALYDVLVRPVEDLLTAQPAEHLTVVPHRRLHQVPFHALHDGRSFLAQRWATTLSSATPRGSGSPARFADGPGRLLALGVPDARAPLVAEELRAVAAVVDQARVAVGPEATTDLLSAELPGPGLVHLACHGVHRADNPLFSAIRLADRWLTCADILDLDLGGATVTLSACETGSHGGDEAEPVGLAWAFLAAGASSVVVSQWVVDDRAAAAFMPRFYRHLTHGAAPPEALRRAQLATLDDHPHPYFWGAFTHVTSPLSGGWSPS